MRLLETGLRADVRVKQILYLLRPQESHGHAHPHHGKDAHHEKDTHEEEVAKVNELEASSMFFICQGSAIHLFIAFAIFRARTQQL